MIIVVFFFADKKGMTFLSRWTKLWPGCLSRAVMFFILSAIVQPLFSQAPEEGASDREKRYLLLAESLYHEGRFQHALPLYLDFLELYPDSRYRARALETLAGIYEKEQRYPEALDTYRLLYQDAGVSNKGLGYLYNQARILSLMGERERAEKIYREIIRISPDGPYARKAKINSKLGHLFEEEEQPAEEPVPGEF